MRTWEVLGRIDKAFKYIVRYLLVATRGGLDRDFVARSRLRVILGSCVVDVSRVKRHLTLQWARPMATDVFVDKRGSLKPIKCTKKSKGIRS